MLVPLIYFGWFLLLFIIIGITRNKDRQYIKQTFFSLIILSILVALIFLQDEQRYIYFEISIYVGVFSLIGYIFSDAKKKEK